MKKLYELDPSKEFNDGDIGTTSDEDVTHEGLVAGNFEAVSGVGVFDIIDDEEQENNLQDMLAKLNARTDEDMMNDLERQEQERERYRLEEEERLRQAKERFNKERYEKEQAALAKKREEEELERQEQERLKQEEAERRKNNPLFKFASKLGKKKENENEECEEEIAKKNSLFGKKKNEVEETKEVEIVEEISSESTEEIETTIVSSPEEEFAPEPEVVEAELRKKNKIEEVEESFDDNEDEESKKKKFSISSMLSAVPKKEKKDKPVKVAKTTKDNAKSKLAEDEPDWKYIATHDELTGLLNTRAYNEDFAKMSSKLGIIFFDINNLKYTNDTLFHEAGNKLIKEVVLSIKEQFKEDNLYRIGGDEFVYLIEKPTKCQAEKIESAIIKIHNDLESKTKRDKAEKMVYSVSAGFAIGDGKASKEDVLKAAEASMYQNKKAYKMSHPELDKRGQGETKEVKKDKPQPEHDELLTKEQKQLKNKIKDEHEKVSKGSTQQIMREVQRRAGEIEAIFIASPSFDHLFVITDIDDFLDIMEQQKALIDYSYLYIVYHGGPQYYGADEYYKEEITDLFLSGYKWFHDCTDSKWFYKNAGS